MIVMEIVRQYMAVRRTYVEVRRLYVTEDFVAVMTIYDL